MIVPGGLRAKILAGLADPESAKILSAILEKPKSALILEGELGISQSTLYRKISDLKDAGLMMVVKYDVSPDGRKEALYACTFKEIRLRGTGPEFVLELVETPRSLENRWFRLFYAQSGVNSEERASSSS